MLHRLILISLGLSLIVACSPTVKVQAPDKPIEINLNVKIEQEVKIKLDKEVDELLEEDSDLFGIPEAKE